ncbi:MAG: creatininase family protein [Rhodovarius sp.]|nr:creatininase family protein [Rhodovarius sp.]MDW8314932.1 creatininase family protein [Rhodovarius sp.]
MPLPSRYWADLPWPAFRSLPPDTVALLPLAAIEQHGPHLPVSVDATINEGIVERVLRGLEADFPLLVLPTQKIGCSVEHLRFPGTLTSTPETLIALWTEIGDSVARAGIRRLVMLNSHGGQVQVMEIVARRLRIRHDMLVVPLSWSRLGMPPGLVTPLEGRYGIHAGQIETAAMLALRPDLVDMSKAKDFRSAWMVAEDDFPHLIPGGGAAIAWQAQDLHPAGAVGDASRATAADGEAILDLAARRILALLQEVRRFDAAAWVGRTPDPDA